MTLSKKQERQSAPWLFPHMSAQLHHAQQHRIQQKRTAQDQRCRQRNHLCLPQEVRRFKTLLDEIRRKKDEHSQKQQLQKADPA